MAKQFMPEVSDKERIMILQQNADKIEQVQCCEDFVIIYE